MNRLRSKHLSLAFPTATPKADVMAENRRAARLAQRCWREALKAQTALCPLALLCSRQSPTCSPGRTRPKGCLCFLCHPRLRVSSTQPTGPLPSPSVLSSLPGAARVPTHPSSLSSPQAPSQGRQVLLPLGTLSPIFTVPSALALTLTVMSHFNDCGSVSLPPLDWTLSDARVWPSLLCVCGSAVQGGRFGTSE